MPTKTTQGITNTQIENARAVLDNHIVKPLTKEGALESLLFCIGSQATRWETASRIVYEMRKHSHGDINKYSSWKTLTDKNAASEAARRAKWRFAKGGRFDESIAYFGRLKGEWWKEILNSGVEEREKYCSEVKWLNRKTFSFWHICLGGTNLIALDVYVMRGLNNMGIEMDSHYFTPKTRSKGSQKVRKTPSKTEYLKIEESARELFSQDSRFTLPNGSANMAMIDGVLWWGGASRNGIEQLNFFGEGAESNTLPYSGYKLSS